jgi:hypothetical protein
VKNLGFSYQKARFVSDHHDPDKHKPWCEVTWPAIVRQARRRKAMLLFADAASFAQWGSMGCQERRNMSADHRLGMGSFGILVMTLPLGVQRHSYR